MFLFPTVQNSVIQDINLRNLSIKYLTDNDYCLISLKKEIIILSYFINSKQDGSNICKINFVATSCDLLFDLITHHKILSKFISVSHALYIGKEIYKAELSQILSQAYIQS